MESVNQFLLKFQKLAPPHAPFKQALIAIIKKITGAELTAAQITVRGQVVYLTITPALRSEIFIHQPKILSELHETLPHQPLSTIR